MKVATDIGGTFTDLVAIDENGSLILEKAHTTPPNFDQGVMAVSYTHLDVYKRQDNVSVVAPACLLFRKTQSATAFSFSEIKSS